MTLYHFCAAHMKDAILTNGLTLGGFTIPCGLGFKVIPKVQWLTAEPDDRKQSWATRNLVPYSRTAFRLTVRVPDSYHKKLVKATEYVKRFPEEARGIVLDWPGSTAWYVFLGKIPPKWIVGCRRMEVHP